MNGSLPRGGGDEELVSLRNAWKYYGSFAALAEVNLALKRGEVHMLLGENGAGKSTLVGLLTGAAALDRGELVIRGVRALGHSPTAARSAGINVVLQDFSLAPALTVAENFFLNREETRFGLLKRSQMRARAAAEIGRLGVEIDVDRRVADLSRAEQQIVEIARALSGRPGVLILDEPTAALSHEESEKLFAIVLRLKMEGWAILYVTHRMEELRRLGDRVTVLRNGRLIACHALGDASNQQLISEMVGRPLDSFYPNIASTTAGVALHLQDVSSADGTLTNVALQVHRGEIVGLGGLVGCGKADVGRAVFGLTPLTAGRIEVEGRNMRGMSQRALLRNGVIYLPQDRRGEALALNRSISENVSLEAVADRPFASWGWVRTRLLQRLVSDIVTRLDIRPARSDAMVASLSGGNQQKVVLGRALTRDRVLYVFDEPTAGVDVGARFEFYAQLKTLCEQGAAILLITSDLQELINLSHRIYVMHGGRIAAELKGDTRTEVNVVRHAFGA